MFSKVVLPAPLAPMIAIEVPGLAMPFTSAEKCLYFVNHLRFVDFGCREKLFTIFKDMF